MWAVAYDAKGNNLLAPLKGTNKMVLFGILDEVLLKVSCRSKVFGNSVNQLREEFLPTKLRAKLRDFIEREKGPTFLVEKNISTFKLLHYTFVFRCIVSDFWDPKACSLPRPSIGVISQAGVNLPFRSPGHLDPGIEPASPALRADSSPLSHLSKYTDSSEWKRFHDGHFIPEVARARRDVRGYSIRPAQWSLGKSHSQDLHFDSRIWDYLPTPPLVDRSQAKPILCYDANKFPLWLSLFSPFFFFFP